jgi:hypothetical protein
LLTIQSTGVIRSSYWPSATNSSVCHSLSVPAGCQSSLHSSRRVLSTCRTGGLCVPTFQSLRVIRAPQRWCARPTNITVTLSSGSRNGGVPAELTVRLPCVMCSSQRHFAHRAGFPVALYNRVAVSAFCSSRHHSSRCKLSTRCSGSGFAPLTFLLLDVIH